MREFSPDKALNREYDKFLAVITIVHLGGKLFLSARTGTMNRSIAPSVSCSIRYMCWGRSWLGAPLNKREKGARVSVGRSRWLSFTSTNSNSSEWLPSLIRKFPCSSGAKSAAWSPSSSSIGNSVSKESVHSQSEFFDVPQRCEYRTSRKPKFREFAGEQKSLLRSLCETARVLRGLATTTSIPRESRSLRYRAPRKRPQKPGLSFGLRKAARGPTVIASAFLRAVSRISRIRAVTTAKP